jgi:NADH-quinone oxidoreductase subunit N
MYVAIIPKIAMLIFLYILSPQILDFNIFSSVTIGIYVVAILSIIIGSIGLGSQWRIKRFITYSAIAHLGFILLAYVSFS